MEDSIKVSLVMTGMSPLTDALVESDASQQIAQRLNSTSSGGGGGLLNDVKSFDWRKLQQTVKKWW
jgi:hypothetical protein